MGSRMACCSVLLASVASGDGWTDAKRTAARAIDERASLLTDTGRAIWEHAELALKESRSSELLASLLEREGFTVERGVAGMRTAFLASFGSGSPVVAFLAEFDALPGLSQKVCARVEPLTEGAPGHGCGHNLFGAGSAGAGIAVKEAMQAHGLPGTVRVYGTPAEEQGIGKVFMVREGLFDDVDACLSWHPSRQNEVDVHPSKALRSFEVTFHGRSAHAAAAPWDGVSALDALEAFTTGVNLLREHIPETARIHYVITQGGEAPNVVPARASIWLYTRGRDWREQERVYRHVRAIVEGADRMAWGEEYGKAEAGFRPAEIAMFTGLYDYNVNLTAAKLVHENLTLVGAPAFTGEEQAFARELQAAFGVEPIGMHTEITPFDPGRPPEPGGSTDVANISWVAPTVDLNMANWPLGVPAHSWASTAASGSDAGYRAMLSAAKALALSGVAVLSDEDARRRMREELERSRAGFDYEPPLGPDDRPALPSHMRDGD